MSDDNKQQTHEGSNGTDRKGPSGTNVPTEEKGATVSEEELLKQRIEELRKRDPFIYR